MTRSLSSPCIRSKVRRASSRCGLERGELRLLLPRVEHSQHVAGADRLPGLEQDPFDDAGKVCADGHALHRGHRADRAQRVRPLLLGRHDRRHGFGRRLKCRALRDGGLDLLELDEAQGCDDRSHDPERDNHSLGHMLLICCRGELSFGVKVHRSNVPHYGPHAKRATIGQEGDLRDRASA